MPPDVRDWLPEGHFAWFVLDTVAAVDLAEFYAAYRGDGRSRPAYEPSMMVALLLYAYARGVRSARAIERACEEDVAYRVIAAQQVPRSATSTCERLGPDDRRSSSCELLAVRRGIASRLRRSCESHARRIPVADSAALTLRC